MERGDISMKCLYSLNLSRLSVPGTRPSSGRRQGRYWATLEGEYKDN